MTTASGRLLKSWRRIPTSVRPKISAVPEGSYFLTFLFRRNVAPQTLCIASGDQQPVAKARAINVCRSTLAIAVRLGSGLVCAFLLGASSPALFAEERREVGAACDTLSRGASEIAPLHAARLPLPSGAARPSPCATVGSGYFWTLFYFGPGKKIIALRNLIELHDDGHCEHVKLALNPVGSAAMSDANQSKAFLR